MDNNVTLETRQQNLVTYEVTNDNVFNIFNLPQENLKFCEYRANKDSDGNTTSHLLILELLDEEYCCPVCKCSVHKHAKVTRIFRHISIDDKPIVIEMHLNRYKCKSCDKTFTPSTPLQHGKKRITNVLSNSILTRHCTTNNLTLKSTALSLGVSEYYVRTSVYGYCDGNFIDTSALDSSNEQDVCHFKTPSKVITHIYVDEIATHNRNYITLVYDAITHELLYWVLKNNKDAIQSFINWAGISLSPQVYVACDMNAPFFSAFKELLPECTITFDRFHHMSNIVDDLKIVYMQLAKDLPEDSPVKPLFFEKDKPALRLLFQREPNLKDKRDIKTLRKILNSSDFIKSIYEFYQSIIAFYDQAEQNEDEVDFTKNLLAICKNPLEVESLSPTFAHYKKNKQIYTKCGCEFLLHSSACIVENTKEKAIETNSEASLNESKKEGKHYSAISRMIRRIVTKLAPIASFAKTQLTTGPIEGLNNKLKVFKRAKYGIKSISNFMNLIKLSSLNWHVDAAKTKLA